MRRAAVLMGVVSVLMPGLGHADSDDDTQWEKAKGYLDGVELPLAGTERRYEFCRERARTDEPFCKLLRAAHISFREEDYVATIRFGAAALKRKPRSLRAIRLVGMGLVRIDRCEEAIPYLERGASLKDGSSDMVSDHVYCVIRVGEGAARRSRALRDAELSAHMRGGPFDWWAAARLHLDSGRYETARDRAEKILEGHRDNPNAWRRYAWIMKGLDEVDDAVAAMEQAVALRTEASDKKIEEWGLRDVEDYYLHLVDLLVDAERFDDALRHARALLKAPEEDHRDRAKAYLVEIAARTAGVDAALVVMKRQSVDDEGWAARLRYRQAVRDDAVPDFPAKDVEHLSTRQRVERLILLDELEAAEAYLSEQIKNSDDRHAREMLAELDFRRVDCSAIARAWFTFLSHRSDFADLWEEAVASAAWRNVCSKSHGGFNPAADTPPERAEFARVVHRTAVLLANSDYDDAFREAAKLPAEGPPILHVLGMWVAAGVADEEAFDRHARLAARGDINYDEKLALLFLQVRRKHLPDAVHTWKSFPEMLREQPVLTPTYRAFLAYLVVRETHELDADFAFEMAEKWFRADGPLERWIWKRLQQTGTQIARRSQ